MSDVIEKKIKKEFDNADNKLKKAGVVAAVAGLSPAVAAGLVGEKAAVVAKGAAKKAKEMSIAAQLKRYNPLFPDVYESAAFTVPNMLMIVDDAVRKDVAVCEGAMGWLSNQGGVEVMHLYDEDINTSGLKFLPNPLCDAVYYVDPNHRDTYINIDSLFETFQQQKLAELARVAYCLGARHYSVEIIEEEKTSKKRSAQMEQSANVKIVKANATVSDDVSMTKKAKRRSFTEEIYEEKRTPIRPELNWFKNDDNIVGLIDQVCKGPGTIKSKTLIFEGSKYAGMARSTAAKVDVAVKKIGAKSSAKMQERVEHEYASSMIFKIDF